MKAILSLTAIALGVWMFGLIPAGVIATLFIVYRVIAARRENQPFQFVRR